MEDQRIFDFCVPQSQRLADLVGNRSDLFMVRVLVDAFLAYPRQQESMQTLYRNAFCFTAIITYGRTFGNGARENLPRSLIDTLEPQWIEAHDYFKALRDKWIAHSTNNFERSRVTLQVRFDASGAATPTQVSEGHNMAVSLSSADMQRLGELASRVLNAVKVEIEKEKVLVLEHAATIDLSELIKNPDKFATPDGPQAHDRRRERFDG